MGSGSGSSDPYAQLLASRVVDYNAALRIAAVRLTGSPPTAAEQGQISAAGDMTAQQTAYQNLITDYMNRPTFAKQMYYWWQDQMKIGDTAAFDTAPAYAAELAVNNGSYMNLFTGTTNTCPTFDETAGTFTDAACTNGGPTAGVLTNPGVMQQFFSNFGFRRVRWVQEVWDCVQFPAEISATPIDVGGAAPYTGTFPFNSIAGTDNGGRVNFHDVSAIICADCHSNINHIAPLFAYYDLNGMYQTAISVPTPLDNAPMAQLTDYLPAGEQTAWRFGKQVSDIPSMGAAMAADPSIAACGVARVWNWALGKTDIVDTLQEVPTATIQTQIDAFTAGGFKMKDLIFAIYTSDDFVKF
jgi:hypothetical protein